MSEEIITQISRAFVKAYEAELNGRDPDTLSNETVNAFLNTHREEIQMKDPRHVCECSETPERFREYKIALLARIEDSYAHCKQFLRLKKRTSVDDEEDAVPHVSKKTAISK